jgi:hypothetical protein
MGQARSVADTTIARVFIGSPASSPRQSHPFDHRGRGRLSQICGGFTCTSSAVPAHVQVSAPYVSGDSSSRPAPLFGEPRKARASGSNHYIGPPVAQAGDLVDVAAAAPTPATGGPTHGPDRTVPRCEPLAGGQRQSSGLEVLRSNASPVRPWRRRPSPVTLVGRTS